MLAVTAVNDFDAITAVEYFSYVTDFCFVWADVDTVDVFVAVTTIYNITFFTSPFTDFDDVVFDACILFLVFHGCVIFYYYLTVWYVLTDVNFLKDSDTNFYVVMSPALYPSFMIYCCYSTSDMLEFLSLRLNI